MAIWLGSGGNTAIVLGGVWNSPEQPVAAWTNPLAGLAAFTLAGTLRVDAAVRGTRLAQQWGPSVGNALPTFEFFIETSNQVRFRVYNNTTSPGVPRDVVYPINTLVADETARFVCRWRGSDGAIAVWKNGVALTGGTVTGPVFATLTPQGTGRFAPIEIGAASFADLSPVQGAYAEWAIWSAYLSDADVAAYGLLGHAPPLLSATGRLKYVSLRAPEAPVTMVNGFDGNGPKHAVLTDAWSGDLYGACSQAIVYNFGTPFLMPPTGVFGDNGAFTEAWHPPVVTSLTPDYISPPARDNAILPERRFELYELEGHAGARSGTVRLVGLTAPPALPPGVTVTTHSTVQAAMTAARWGDDVILNHASTFVEALIPPNVSNNGPITAATPRKPPGGQRVLSGRTPLTSVAALTALVTPACTSALPSAIRVMADTVATAPAAFRATSGGLLPAVSSRAIAMPDGSVERVLHEDSRITDADVARLATIAPATGTPIATSPNLGGTRAAHWLFQGLHLKQNPVQGTEAPAIVDLGGDALFVTSGNGNGFGREAWWGRCPERILVNQCLLEGDPLKTGVSANSALWAGGTYIGIVNSRSQDCYGMVGESAMAMLGGIGPYHFENNELPGIGGIFSGGSLNFVPGALPQDVILRRNHLYLPYRWRPTEVNPYQSAWTVTVTGSPALTVTWNAFPPTGETFNTYGPLRGGYMYQPSTGKAAQIAQGKQMPAALATPWPGGAPGVPITVQFQIGQVGGVIYNSGIHHPLGLATTDGTATVTFSEALPATAVSEAEAPGRGHYFYLNDTTWRGSGTFSGGAYSWGGYPDSPRPRRKILTIAGDRLSCTLDAAYAVSLSYCYTITPFDGLKRSSTQAAKNMMETKEMTRLLREGNVTEKPINEWMHPTSQGTSFGPFTATIALTGTRVTLTGLVAGGTPLAAWLIDYVGLRATFGAPWMWVVFTDGSYNFGNTIPILRRVTAGAANGVGSVWDTLQGSGPFATDGSTTIYIGLWSPHTETSDQLDRYSIYRTWGSKSHHPGGTGTAEIVPGARYAFHDNLCTHAGLAHCAASISNEGIQPIAWNINNGHASTVPQAANVHVKGSEHNGTLRFRHNTHVHGDSGPKVAGAFHLTGGGGPYDKAFDIVVSDNIIDGLNAGIQAVFDDVSIGQHGVAQPIGQAWHPGEVCARNVFVGASAADAVSHTNLSTVFPDNVGISSNVQVGYGAFVADQVPDAVDPVDYTLADIYTTGTVAISGTGLDVTLESGAWPGQVVAGQFFKTATSAVRRRIFSLTRPLGAAWDTITTWAPLQKVDGRARATTFPSLRNGQTYNGVVLPDNQWAQVVVPTLAPVLNNGIVLLLRFNPTTRNGYRAVLSVGATPAVILQRFDADVGTTLASAAVTVTAGDTLLLEGVGATLTLSRNGSAIATASSATHPSGKVGIGMFVAAGSAVDQVELDPFTCGDFSGPGATRATLATDTFDGVANTLTLTTPYPERSVAGQAFAITFRGSATDGTDPGANIPLLVEWTRGVKQVPT